MVVQQCIIGWGTVPENGEGRRGDTEEGKWDYMCSGEEEGDGRQERNTFVKAISGVLQLLSGVATFPYQWANNLPFDK